MVNDYSIVKVLKYLELFLLIDQHLNWSHLANLVSEKTTDMISE